MPVWAIILLVFLALVLFAVLVLIAIMRRIARTVWSALQMPVQVMQEEARRQESGGKPVITTTAREVSRPDAGEAGLKGQKQLPVNLNCPNCGGSPVRAVTAEPDGSTKCEFCGQWYNVRRS